MKKSISIIFTLSMLFVFTSCFKTEENKWDETSSERMTRSLAEYEDLLCAAENGWVLDYFANPFEQGYPLLFKFEKNASVVIAGKDEVSTGGVYKASDPTSFELIADNGPVLTFNTYNPILHAFCVPWLDPAKPDGLGHQGDYEFVIISGDENEFWLKGKKRGYLMRMYKAPVDKQWEDIYTELATIKNNIFKSNVKALILVAGEERYRVNKPAQGMLELYPLNNPDALADYYSYNVELDGTIRLIDAFRGANGDMSITAFRVAESGVLASVEGDTPATISTGNLNEYILLPGMSWRWNKSGLKGQIAELYTELSNEASANSFGKLQSIDLKYDETAGSFVLLMKTYSGYSGLLFFDTQAEGTDKLTLKFNKEATAASTSSDAKNGLIFYENLTSLQKIVTTISTTQTLTTSSPTSPVEMTMTDAAGNVIPMDVK